MSSRTPARIAHEQQLPLAYTEIDLEAIAHNTRVLAAIAANADAQLMTVVKADGYSHGAVEVAREALANGANQLGVATLAEAHALRNAGIEAPILAWIWSPDQDIDAAIAAKISLGVPSVAHAQAVVGKGATLCIKIDSGLNRSGVDEAEWGQVFALLQQEQVTGLFSHLSCADGVDEASKHATDEQGFVFQRAIDAARAAGLAVPVNHLCNSPATLTRGDLAFDMVRPGLAVYGCEPIDGLDHGLRPAMTWAGRVTVVKRIAKGEGASYGLTWRAPEDGFTAVVPIGYADGLPRAVQGHLEVTIHGRRYPQVGRVCMDQIVVWLGNNPEHVVPGDEAVLFGPGDRGEMTATELATAIGTINYELLCAPKGRTQRIHVRRRRCEDMVATQALGEEIGATLRAGDVVLLDGPLGAGKTTFTQGLARGLGVKGRVTSPTFVLAREHRSTVGGPNLVHVDAYRLLDGPGEVDLEAELDSLDLDTELQDAVVVAEWGGGLVEKLAPNYVLVQFDRESAVRLDPTSEARIITWRRA